VIVPIAYGFSKFVCWLVFRLGYGLEVTGGQHVPARGAFIVASNHVSFLDPPLVGAACPRRLTFLARADLFEHRLLGWWMRSVGVVSVKRGEADPAAIRRAVAALRRGRPVAIFPEGGRQLSGALGTAKRGVGLLAEAGRAPVIPVYVSGTSQALPPGSKRLLPAKIRVAFGPPITYTTSSTPELASRVRHEQLAKAVTHAWRALEAALTR
jgi:1-acyl-sn-glycerol-3-phosphate acyltransferase